MRSTVLSAIACLFPVMACAGAAGPAGTPVLNEKSFWRWHITRKPVKISYGSNGSKRQLKAIGVDSWESPPPPEGWRAAEFDDSAWPRCSLSELYRKEFSNVVYVLLVCCDDKL